MGGKMINKITNEYLQDVLIRLAYHSTGIDGNTITLSDTVSILIYQTISSNTSKSEFFEIDNHERAFSTIINYIKNNKQVSTCIVKEIHRELLNHLDHKKGNFKEDYNFILGASFDTATPEKTPSLMNQWCKSLNYQLEIAITEEEKIKVILQKHIEFERISPFNGGNGVTVIYLLL